MNRYIVTTTTNRRFVVTAGTPEAAKSQVENPRTEKCVYTGKVLLHEEGIPAEKVEVLPRCWKFNDSDQETAK